MPEKIKHIIDEINHGAEKYKKELQLNGRTPGFSILIKKQNQIIYEKSTGKSAVSSRSPKSSLSRNSRFLCASLTKPVICKFFIDLKRKKPDILQIKLDKFFSNYKRSYIKKITVQHLLSHKSGLQEYFGSSSSVPYHRLDKFNLKQISEHILNQKKLFDPNSKTEYSNSSFVILSRIVEILFKNKYEEEFKKYLKSLGSFENTFFFSDKKTYNTNQYVKIGKKYIKAPWSRTFTGWGDGALISSPADYLDIINPFENKEITEYLFKIKSPLFNLCHFHTGGSVGASNIFFCIPKINIRGICCQNFTNSFDEMTLPQDIYKFLSGGNTNYLR